MQHRVLLPGLVVQILAVVGEDAEQVQGVLDLAAAKAAQVS